MKVRFVGVLGGLLVLVLSVSRASGFVGALDLMLGGDPSVSISPAGFGTDSAELTNEFLPLIVGEQVALSGFGARSGDLKLYSAIAVDLVGGVQCLRVRDDTYSSSSWRDSEGVWHLDYEYSSQEYWLAQDGEGNVWRLKMVSSNGFETVFNVAEPPAEMWSMVSQYDTWTDLAGGDGEVLEDSSVGPLRTGFGSFEGCVHTRTMEPGGSTVDRYYAPEAGLVKEVYTGWDGERYGYDRVPLAAFPQPGYGIVEFSSDTYSAREEAGTFPVTAVRTEGSQGVVFAAFIVAGGMTTTADGAESPFTADPKLLFFAPGQTRLTFDVTILDNPVWDHTNTLDLQMDAPDGLASLGARSSATVFVDESESGTDPGTFIGPCFLDTLKSWW